MAEDEEGADNSAKEGEAESRGAAVGGQGDRVDASAT